MLRSHYELYYINHGFPEYCGKSVVMCHECMYHAKGKCWVPKFHLARGTYTEDMGFCAWGKRRNNSEETTTTE